MVKKTTILKKNNRKNPVTRVYNTRQREQLIKEIETWKQRADNNGRTISYLLRELEKEETKSDQKDKDIRELKEENNNLSHKVKVLTGQYRQLTLENNHEEARCRELDQMLHEFDFKIKKLEDALNSEIINSKLKDDTIESYKMCARHFERSYNNFRRYFDEISMELDKVIMEESSIVQLNFIIEENEHEADLKDLDIFDSVDDFRAEWKLAGRAEMEERERRRKQIFN